MQSFPHSLEYQHYLTELRAARESIGMTQQELADKLRVHQTLVSKSERGTRRLDVVELRAWLMALGSSLAEFTARWETRVSRHRHLPSLLPAAKSPRHGKQAKRKQGT